MNCYYCKISVNDYDIFCYSCGKELINRCSNSECTYSLRELKQIDKYCRLCGSNTTFNKNKSINKELNFELNNEQQDIEAPQQDTQVPRYDIEHNELHDDDDIPF